METNRRTNHQTEEMILVSDVGYTCLFRCDPAGRFQVTCPKLVSVIAFGENIAQARAAVREEIEAYLMSLYEEGEHIPEPDYAPSWRFGSALG